MERERGDPFRGYFAYLSKTSSVGFPGKGTLHKVPFMESLAERCPTTRSLPTAYHLTVS